MRTTNRYKTRVAVVIHSHVNQPETANSGLDVSGDVIELSTNKSIKGVGNFSFTLVPRKNYLNLIFPNDVVNIYIDPGDGKTGLTRTMFGFVDRIERTETVDRNTGAMTTLFQISGSDFAKAIEKTDIYFNPDLGLRPDVSETFGNTNLGGNALRTKGVRIHGTPADIVEDLLELMFGFGAQWLLPKSYPKNYVLANRKQRVQRAIKRFPTELKDQLKAMGYSDNVSNARLLDDIANFLQDKNANFSDLNFRRGDFDVLDVEDARRITIQDQLATNSTFLAYQSALKKTGDVPVTLLDLLDTSFIESLAIDGYIQAESIWQSKGSLMSILHANANEIVNELCFDLRPVAAGGQDNMSGKAGTEYDRTSDELGVNINGTEKISKGPAAGVRYVPAVIMREYPHSVAEGLDLSGHIILGTDKVGFIPMGPVFAQGAGEGLNRRYYFDYNDSNQTSVPFVALTPVVCDFKNDAKPVKHIDVVAINNSDVTGATVGRSDADTYNLITLYSSNPLMKDFKFLIMEFVPTLTQVSIERNGLRVLDTQSKFASTTADPLCHMSGTNIDNVSIRKNIIRWALLLDHWNQHNIEYLSGSIQLRGMPELRVGYRLDWLDRSESYYVEQVSHAWRFPDVMTTTVQVSRGQRNDPFPIYVPPAIAEVDKAAVQKTLPQEGDNTFLDGGEVDAAEEASGSTSWAKKPPVKPLAFLSTRKDSTSAFHLTRLVRGGGTRPHLGNDYRLSKGDKVYAVADGIVRRVGYQSGSSIVSANNATANLPANKYGAGNGGLFIEIEHVVDGDTYHSRYMHLDSFIGTNREGNATLETIVGAEVVAGQQIATGGDSGLLKPGGAKMTPHLHFEIRKNGKNVDPQFYLASLGLGKPLKPAAPKKDKEEVKVSKDLSAKGRQIGGGDRSDQGRLSDFFVVKDTNVTIRARDGKTTPGNSENVVDKKRYPRDYEKAWPAKANKSRQLDDAVLTAKKDDTGIA